MASLTIHSIPQPQVRGDSNRDLFLKLKAQITRLEEKLTMMDSKTDYLMTRDQVAKLFQVDGRTVTAWLNQGRLPGVIADSGGTRVKYRHSDVMAFMQSLEAVHSNGAYKEKKEARKK